MIPLWHLDAKLVVYKGVELVRVTHRTKADFFDGRQYRDLDSKQLLGGGEGFIRTKDFIRKDLGFQFPLPLGPRTLCRILQAEVFPKIEDWEKFCGADYYLRPDYHNDLRIFFASSGQPKTHEELWKLYERGCVRLQLGKSRAHEQLLSVQDRGVYARELLRSFPAHKKRLDEFLGPSETPEQFRQVLGDLEALSAAWVPEFKRSKAKMMKHADHDGNGQTDRLSKKPKKIFSASTSFQTDWYTA